MGDTESLPHSSRNTLAASIHHNNHNARTATMAIRNKHRLSKSTHNPSNMGLVTTVFSIHHHNQAVATRHNPTTHRKVAQAVHHPAQGDYQALLSLSLKARLRATHTNTPCALDGGRHCSSASTTLVSEGNCEDVSMMFGT